MKHPKKFFGQIHLVFAWLRNRTRSSNASLLSISIPRSFSHLLLEIAMPSMFIRISRVVLVKRRDFSSFASVNHLNNYLIIFRDFVIPYQATYPSNFTNDRFWTKTEFSNVAKCKWGSLVLQTPHRFVDETCWWFMGFNAPDKFWSVLHLKIDKWLKIEET